MTYLASAPVGIFDSGLGGLSVLTHLQRQLPFENYIYLADTLHIPYGSRSEENIRNLTLDAVDWLVAQGCKLVVIACNSASAHGLQSARQRYPNLPIVGLVPALKPAVMHTQTKQVAVLATPATLQGYLLNEVIDQVALPQQITVHKYSFASLVPWVEAGMPSTHPAVTALDILLDELDEKKVDQLVLGCTHFPFFKTYLQNRIQQKHKKASEQATSYTNLTLLDSGEAIAKRVNFLLLKEQVANPQQMISKLKFYTTANLTVTKQVATRLFEQFLPQLQVDFYEI